MTWYVLLIAVIAVERLAELVVSNRNRAWSRGHGGTEFGAGHYPAMVALHVALLVGCLVEPLVMHRPFIPALGWPMLAVVVAAQVLRWWCITTLGPQWNTRVIVIPDAPRVTGGPYRFLPHPNYVAVVRRGDRASAGAQRVDHRDRVHGAQRGAAAHPNQGRERRAGEPDVIDLLVAGGGPAGLATALYGARAGLEVVVVERREGVLDKACGEGMMPHTLAHVDRLGIVPKGRPLHGITYLAGSQPGRGDVPRRRGTGGAKDRAARSAARRRRGGRRAVRQRRRRRGHAGRRVGAGCGTACPLPRGGRRAALADPPIPRPGVAEPRSASVGHPQARADRAVVGPRRGALGPRGGGVRHPGRRRLRRHRTAQVRARGIRSPSRGVPGAARAHRGRLARRRSSRRPTAADGFRTGRRGGFCSSAMRRATSTRSPARASGWRSAPRSWR